MNPRRTWSLLLVLLLPLAFACSPREEAHEGEHTATEMTEVTEPGALDEAEVNDVTMGTALSADGSISDQGDDFAPGQQVYLAMQVEEAERNVPIRVVWYGPGEQQIGEQTKTVTAPDERYVNFQAVDTSSWAKGDYRAEVWLGSELVNTQHFQIVDPSEAGT